MKSFAAAFVASGLAATAAAGSVHNRHLNFHAKKDASASAYMPAPSANATSCGCTTYTTTWYGEWGLVPEPSTYVANTTTSSTYVAPTTTSSSTYVAPTTTSSTSSSIISSSSSSSSSSSISSTSSSSSWEAPSSSSTSTSVWVAPTSYAAPSSSWSAASSYAASSASASPSSSSSDSGSISSNGNQWAMTYTPYANDGSCKSWDDIQSDIGQIAGKGFTSVRLYATDCDGPAAIGNACKTNGMKMILGIYIDGSGIGGNTDEQISTLTQWGQSGNWDLVEMVVAGNEAVFNGYCSASDLAGFISDVKSQFGSAGYSGPVTTTEPLGTVQENADTLCGAVDVIAANIHPFFNADVDADGAGDFVASQLQDLAACCNNEKDAYNLETGWPSSSTISSITNGLAIPGFSEQKTAIDSILAKAGSKSAIFSFSNDMWKSPGDMGVEQFWGCSDLFSG